MNPPSAKTPSEVFLIAANLLPLAGALFWGWKVFDIMFVYWLENVIIGIFHAAKMSLLLARKKLYAGFPIVIFFIFHYGMFCMGHGVFLVVLFGLQLKTGQTAEWAQVHDLLSGLMSDPLFLLAIAGLVGSHAFSFFDNFIRKKEIDRTNPALMLMGPYGRIVVLHLVIILGGGVALVLGQPVWALAMLTILKTFSDLQAHRRSHQKLAEKQ